MVGEGEGKGDIKLVFLKIKNKKMGKMKRCIYKLEVRNTFSFLVVYIVVLILLGGGEGGIGVGGEGGCDSGSGSGG